MKPTDLDEIVREEAELVGMSPEPGQEDLARDDRLAARLSEILEETQPGWPVDTGQDVVSAAGSEGHLSRSGLGADAHEIELAIDELAGRHSLSWYDLLMPPEYVPDPHYMPDYMVPIPGQLMPDPPCGPCPDT